MRILLATYWSVPHLGGVWNYMIQLKNQLEALGHQVDLLGYDKDNQSVYMVNENRKLEREKLMPFLEAQLSIENYPKIYENELVRWTEFQRYVYELSAAYFGLEKYDLIHTHDVLSTYCIDRVRPRNIPLVATIHGSVAHEIRGQLTNIHKSDTAFMAQAYYDEIERIGSSCADVTITANNWLKNILTTDFQVPDEQIKVLHYGFDIDEFIKQMKKKSSIRRPEKKQVIIYAGRLTKIKGVQHLLTALSELKTIRKDWVCWVVGDGEKKEELENQTKELGLEDDVLFLGKRDDVPYLISIADIFVLPSLIDSQPLAVIEAQIAGKAIIVSDAGGLPEMVKNRKTGLVTPAGDPEMLCKNINKFLKNKIYQRILGYNAKMWGLSHWSMNKGVKRLLEVYDYAISKRKQEQRVMTYKK